MKRKTDNTEIDEKATAKILHNYFSPGEMEIHARSSGFMKRKRGLHPHALVLAILCCLGSGKVDWLADILRAHNRITKKDLKYKPFHNQLSKRAFPEFMRVLLEIVMNKFFYPVIEPIPNDKCAMFDDIIIHDGTSFALKASLEKEYPGRFRKSSPAAVELHVTMSAIENQPNCIQMAADKEAEKHFRPEPASLIRKLFLGDRGYQDKHYFKQIIDALGYFIIRGTKNIRPLIVKAFDEHGNRVRGLEGKKLTPDRLKRQSLDLLIEWRDGNSVYSGRLVVLHRIGARNKHEYCYLHTNLSRDIFIVDEIANLYRFRWQGELLFKEWKSHSNLHRFDTGKPPIAEGMIWASLLVATVKRTIAHAAELSRKVELSTQRVASSARYFLFDVVGVLLKGSLSQLVAELEKIFDYLTSNARRAHPNRDRKKGRFRFGLRPVSTA